MMKSEYEWGDFKDNICFEDKKGRCILIRSYNSQQDRDELVDMYGKFDSDDRCLGLPPVSEGALKTWLDYIGTKGASILAEHNGEVVGHLSVVPCGNEVAEVTIFL